MEQIEAKHLTFTYQSAENYALCDISFSINAGEFITICGPSGSGKSTLLRHLKPILAPNGVKDGAVFFGGRDVLSLSQREQSEKIGFVMQNPDSQIVTDKVWHELAFGLESLSYSTTQIRAKVSEMASFFGIQNWFYKNTNELSGGQKQLLNLASVMVMQPSVLILDEPTAQLDPIAAQTFLDTLSKINRELGTTVILSEHRLEEAFPLSDRVFVMEKGALCAVGTPREVGSILADKKVNMFSYLPTPMKVYHSVKNCQSCPITVREGKKWLDNFCKESTLNEIPITEPRNTARGETAVSLKDVWFRYEKNLPDVIKGLSLTVNKGEFYVIVGGNATGKTTALSLMGALLTPYRGTIEISGKCAMLPQNPKALFTKKTVKEDLYAMQPDEKKLQSAISICELHELLFMHPYDLSGGEQQRVALAKVLLTNPDVLLLDEPTKGLDANFKETLADIFQSLKKSGKTIIMVSHDIEFCAKYADRCGMFFDGAITSEDAPRAFFAGNRFYTTAANRMARTHLPNAILAEDIILSCGGKQPKEENPTRKKTVLPLPEKEVKTNEQNGVLKDTKNKKKNVRRSPFTSLIFLLTILLTLILGTHFFGNRKYYFISLLLILETLFGFFFAFEKRKPKAGELVLIGMLCALAVAGRACFYMLPQFKPMVALIIVSGVAFGGETGFLVGAASALLSNFFFGQGPWTPWQMFALGIIGFLAGTLFQKGRLSKSKLSLCIFGGLATFFIYGGILNPASVLLTQEHINIKMILSSYIAGLPFDLIHAFSTTLFLWLFAVPMLEKLNRIKIKYNLMDNI